MDDGPLWWPVQRLVDAYRRGSVSPVEVAALAQERIDRVDPTLHAFVLTTPELAHRQAVEAEAAYRTGNAGPLAGVPVSIKDAFHVEGHVTTLGSLAHADDVAGRDSGAVRRLRRAGAVIVGKTNVPEFCQSATTDNLLGPDTANPFDPRPHRGRVQRWCGGRGRLGDVHGGARLRRRGLDPHPGVVLRSGRTQAHPWRHRRCRRVPCVQPVHLGGTAGPMRGRCPPSAVGAVRRGSRGRRHPTPPGAAPRRLVRQAGGPPDRRRRGRSGGDRGEAPRGLRP